MKPKKVCIIYSGQTRLYNEDYSLFESHKKLADELKTRYNIDVDFIGHTWSDQPAPFNVNDFTHFMQEPQSIIDDWVNTNFFKRAWWDPNNPEFENFYKENFKNKNANAVIEKIFENSRHAYGQIFSFFNCISQIENTYDAYFRTRWDIKILKTQGLAEFFPYAIGENDNKRLVLFDGRAWIKPVSHDSRINNNVVTTTFLNDQNFLINHKAMWSYLQMDYLNELHWNIVRSPYNDSKPSSHTLWTAMHPTNIEGRFVLQGDCYKIIRNDYGVKDKQEKNKWSI